MDLQKEDIRKKLYEFGCGYMLDEYMELFNEIGKIYHKKQLHIPVVMCCRCGKQVVSKWALKEQEEELKEYIKCEKHLIEYRMQEEDMYWQ